MNRVPLGAQQQGYTAKEEKQTGVLRNAQQQTREALIHVTINVLL